MENDKTFNPNHVNSDAIKTPEFSRAFNTLFRSEMAKLEIKKRSDEARRIYRETNDRKQWIHHVRSSLYKQVS